MSEQRGVYTEAEVIGAVQAGAEELFGRNTIAASLLAGEVAMKLYFGLNCREEETDHESIDWTSPPDYALRAIRSSSTKQLVDLMTNGAQRLSKSVASYCDHFRNHPEDANGATSLSPYIFPEGSNGETAIGELIIQLDPENSMYGSIANLTLLGGESAPYDPLAKPKDPTHLERSLNIRQTTVKDPVTGKNVPIYYPEVTVRYGGDTFMGKDGTLYEVKNGKPISAYGHVVIADLFWALDMAITYYENQYIASIKRTGLTYADYRAAGCLKDDLTLDHKKAEAYIRTHMSDTSHSVDADWPVLRDWKTNLLTMDPSAKTEIQKYKDSLKRTIEVNEPQLLHIR